MREVERSFRWWLGTVCGVALGAVLLVALVGKVLDPESFVEAIRGEGLDAWLSAEWVAMTALGLEAALGIALVLGLRRRWTLLPATLLVAFFVFLTARGYWRYSQGLVDESGSCGCFGNLMVRTPAEAFWQDLLLLVPPLALAWVGRRKGLSFPLFRLAVVGAGTVATLLLAWKAPELPLDDLATRLRPGVTVSEVCAESSPPVCLSDVAPELLDGEHWAVMVDLEEDAESWEPAVDAYVISAAQPPLVVLTAASPEAVHTFFWEWGPAFELREAPSALLRPLHRRLPRSFRVVDGRVVETVSGLPGEVKREGAG
jgi:uncharacterized membrane protein YphA (DoxX/SURF4 family)